MDWDMEPTIPCRRITCPKCGKDATRLTELWEGHTIHFQYRDGMRGREGFMKEGNPYAVNALCGCGHVWTLRSTAQITALDTDVAAKHAAEGEGT
jgi:hypothetical protein